MVLCSSAVPFSSVGDLPGLSLPSHVQVVFHNRCCHGKAVAGTDKPNSWSGRQKLRSDAQNGQLSEGLQLSLLFWDSTVSLEASLQLVKYRTKEDSALRAAERSG